MNGQARRPRYVLITPARNEEAFLEETVRSVTGQTVLPEKWIIVSDGSTDGTDDIIRRRAVHHDWIHYVRQPEHAGRQFAAKAMCIAAGLAVARAVPHEIIGNLDADVSFEPDTMEFLLDRFAEDPRLGVAGVPFIDEKTGSYDYRFTNIEHVSGACQLFRRACFEEIGGYKPIEAGGIDWLAVTTARMMGWKTRTFTERSVVHHRKIGTGRNKGLRALFHQGKKDYCFGSHPLWELFRAVYQMRHRPFLAGGLAIFAGYVAALAGRADRTAPAEVIRFSRHEQMQRLGTALKLRNARRIEAGK